MELMRTATSPLESIDTSFSHYVAKRRRREQEHMDNGVPDYAFALDYELRRRLERIPHFGALCKKITSTIVSREMQKLNQDSVAVGPSQYAEIYRMGVDCANRLGIGIPTMFVLHSSEVNAGTYAFDDISPMIVLHSALIERMTPAELKCIIAHECGHIHNNHGVYRLVVCAILNEAAGITGAVLSLANIALMQFWTRASEITADRAGIICGDQIEDAISAQKKLMTRGTVNQASQADLDLDALKEQLDMTMNNPSKIYEIFRDHPSSIRRIFCMKEFAECETFYKWRSELKKTGTIARSKAETDARCQRLVNIVDN